jgi:hypothetical protein
LIRDPIADVMRTAEEWDISFDVEAASLYIQNCAASKLNPTDPEVQRIARHFECIFYFARPDFDLFDFLGAPECPENCPECRALEERQDARMAARLAKCPPPKIADRIVKLGLLRRSPENAIKYRCPDATEGTDGFLERTGLTSEDISQMSDAELLAFR